MSIYTLVLLGVTVLVVVGLVLAFMLLNWFDKRVDKKNRMGQSAYRNQSASRDKTDEH